MCVCVGTAAHVEGAIRRESHCEQTPANAHDTSVINATVTTRDTFSSPLHVLHCRGASAPGYFQSCYSYVRHRGHVGNIVLPALGSVFEYKMISPSQRVVTKVCGFLCLRVRVLVCVGPAWLRHQGHRCCGSCIKGKWVCVCVRVKVCVSVCACVCVCTHLLAHGLRARATTWLQDRNSKMCSDQTCAV